MSFDMSTAQEVPASETLNPSSKPKFDMASAVDISNQPPDNWQNVLHQASRSVIDSNRQAQAGASEFLRNPMGGADSYMKGFNNPQGSETFANQFIRQDMEKNPGMIEDKNTIPAFLQTLPSNLIGSQVDMMANPLQAASGAAIGKYGGPLIKGIAESPVGKAVGNFGEFISNPSAGYGKALKVPGNVDFHAPVMEALNDPLAAKVIDKSGIMEKYGGIKLGEGGSSSPRLSNLNGQEAQDIINKIKGGLSKTVVDGEHLAPKHLPITNLLSQLSEAQNELPGMTGAKRFYGVAKEVPEVIGKIAKRALLGSQLGGGYEIGAGLVKKIFGL